MDLESLEQQMRSEIAALSTVGNDNTKPFEGALYHVAIESVEDTLTPWHHLLQRIHDCRTQVRVLSMYEDTMQIMYGVKEALHTDAIKPSEDAILRDTAHSVMLRRRSIIDVAVAPVNYVIESLTTSE